MSNEIERYDGFARAKEEIVKRLPDEFSFEIDWAFFERLDMGTALRRRETMMTFEEEMRDLGYSIRHSDHFDRMAYGYSLKRVRKPSPTLAPKNAIDDGSVIEVETNFAPRASSNP